MDEKQGGAEKCRKNRHLCHYQDGDSEPERRQNERSQKAEGSICKDDRGGVIYADEKEKIQADHSI